MKISDLSFNQLRTFCAVVEHKGFSEAQDELGMTQPAISTHIKDLEIRLGFKLCQRGRSGFSLTEKGQMVYERTKALFSSFSKFQEDMNELKHKLTGLLSVGLVDNIITNSSLPVNQVIEQFFMRDNDVMLDLVVTTPEKLSEELLLGNLQIAIGPFVNRIEKFNYEKIYVEHHKLYCGESHPLYHAQPNALNLQQINEHDIVSRSYLKNIEFDVLENPKIKAWVSNMEAQAILITSGKFLGFLPTHYADQLKNKAQLKPIEIEQLSWCSDFYIVSQQNPSLVVKTLIDDIKQVLNNTVPL